MSKQPVIALISATPAAVGPATSGLAAEFPEASPWNILDDRLLSDANEQGGVTASLADRMNRLIDHAVREGADAVLLTCSQYGEVAHRFASPGIPILAADDAAFGAAIAGGYRRILIVASFESALRDAVKRFEAAVVEAGSTTEVAAVVPQGALDATNAKDDEALFQALLAASREHLGSVDAVLLAQYSLGPAAPRLAQSLGIPVISGPDAAAALLRSRLRTEE